jgi:AcrR family transcriptional regulator
LHLREVLIRETGALLRSGMEEVSLRRVAKAAGVSPMAPYRHFPDKAALLGATAERGFEELRLRLELADASAEGGEALVEQGLAYVAFAQEQPRLFRLMFVGREQACVAPQATQTAYGVLARRVAVLAPPHDCEALAMGCWAMVHGLAMLSLDSAISLDARTLRDVLSALTRSMETPAHTDQAGFHDSR